MAPALKPSQRKAITALLEHGTVKAAAQDAGVSRDTIGRWMADPAFADELRRAERLAITTAARSLARLADKAAGTLAAAMDDTTAPVSVRVRAADAVLARLVQLRTFADLDERVARLEERLAPETRG